MKVLVTGGAGYIGSILTQQLLAENFEVKVLDSLVFGHEGLLPVYGHKNFQFIKGDVRDEKIVMEAVDGVDAVVHLAALVGEPLCKIDPQVAVQINQEATFKLLQIAKEKNVKRFLFASTCSNYGVSDPEKYADEDTPLQPISLYSETKVASEKKVIESNENNFATCVLRFATVHGISPRMRFDLLLNEFLRDAIVKKKLEIFGPKFWRPLVHVRDTADACIKALSVDAGEIGGKVFNIGNTKENYTKLMIAEMIKDRLPETEIEIIQSKSDARNYKVSFDRAKKVLGFETQKTAKDSTDEIVSAVENGILDPMKDEYTNLSTRVKEIKAF